MLGRLTLRRNLTPKRGNHCPPGARDTQRGVKVTLRSWEGYFRVLEAGARELSMASGRFRVFGRCGKPERRRRGSSRPRE